jgi:hypothetical protein
VHKFAFAKTLSPGLKIWPISEHPKVLSRTNGTATHEIRSSRRRKRCLASPNRRLKWSFFHPLKDARHANEIGFDPPLSRNIRNKPYSSVKCFHKVLFVTFLYFPLLFIKGQISLLQSCVGVFLEIRL